MGFSLYEIGLLLGVLQVGQTLLEIPTGFVADRYGNRASLMLAIAGEEDRLTRVNAVSRVIYYCCYGATSLVSGYLMSWSTSRSGTPSWGSVGVRRRRVRATCRVV